MMIMFLQAALMILLTAQSQTAAGQMSVLAQPAVQEVLESLVCSDKTVQDPYSALGLALSEDQTVKTSQSQSHSHSPPPVIANNLNMLSNASSLNQLLGVLSRQPSQAQSTTSPPTTTPTPPTSQQETITAQPVRPALMSVPPPPTPQHHHHHHQQHQQQQHQHQHQQQQQQHHDQLNFIHIWEWQALPSLL